MNNHLQLLQAVYGKGEARAIYMLVMEKAFGLSATDVLLGKDKELSPHDNRELENIVARLLRNEPVQYVLGEADFMGRAFGVEPGVLIPRPETEDLVELAAAGCKAPCRMLDIGTGSGCIAVSLALAGHTVTAMDISPDALRIAAANAARLGAEVTFVREDILHPSPTPAVWDAVVSNPPYIRRCEAAGMEANVLDHEPHLALFVPDADPLLFYRAIAVFAAAHLAPGGRIYLECNRAFATDVAGVLAGNGFVGTCVADDRYGNPRFAMGRLPEGRGLI